MTKIRFSRRAIIIISITLVVLAVIKWGENKFSETYLTCQALLPPEDLDYAAKVIVFLRQNKPEEAAEKLHAHIKGQALEDFIINQAKLSNTEGVSHTYGECRFKRKGEGDNLEKSVEMTYLWSTDKVHLAAQVTWRQFGSGSYADYIIESVKILPLP